MEAWIAAEQMMVIAAAVGHVNGGRRSRVVPRAGYSEGTLASYAGCSSRGRCDLGLDGSAAARVLI